MVLADISRRSVVIRTKQKIYEIKYSYSAASSGTLKGDFEPSFYPFERCERTKLIEEADGPLTNMVRIAACRATKISAVRPGRTIRNRLCRPQYEKFYHKLETKIYVLGPQIGIDKKWQENYPHEDICTNNMPT